MNLEKKIQIGVSIAINGKNNLVSIFAINGNPKILFSFMW